MRRLTQRWIKVLILATLIAFLALQLLGAGIKSKISEVGEGVSVDNKDGYKASRFAKFPDQPQNGRSGAGIGRRTNEEEEEEEGEGDVAVNKADKPAKNSLSGERMNGLPPDSGSSVVVANAKNQTKSAVNKGLTGGSNNTFDIGSVLKEMEEYNSQQYVRNEEIFGPVNNKTTVIAVQVHNRLQYLRQLIVSLSHAVGIENTLIVFSHDFWDPEINKLVASVDFAKTMQIFYPYSIQTHPKRFPGTAPEDCTRNTRKKQAERVKCPNAKWPDKYGHYREAKFTQTKHHWWWKANRIFEQLKVTKNFAGLVLFLEEDHYVTEDFLHVLSMVDRDRGVNCPNCDIICLGTYLKNYNYPRDRKMHPEEYGFMGFPGQRPMAAMRRPIFRGTGPRDTRSGPRDSRTDDYPTASRGTGNQRGLKAWSFLSSVLEVFNKGYQIWPGGPAYSKKQQVDVIQWHSSKHNMGMAFNRSFWEKVRGCAAQFCTFDDYNWDWSLYFISLKCLPEKIQVMLVKAPRVFHIGECGVHHKKKSCEASAVVKKVTDILKGAKTYLFPDQLLVNKVAPKKRLKVPKGNGGWGDFRDQNLCLAMAKEGVRSQKDIDAVLETAVRGPPKKEVVKAAEMTPEGKRKVKSVINL